MRLNETIQKVINLVEEYEDKGGITKNEACRILMEKYGGSRSTYWKSFDYLLGNKGGNLVEARIVPPNKQQKKLFPTESNKRLEEFKIKLEALDKLLDLIDDNSSIGDCYFNDIKSKTITHFSNRYIPYFHQEAEQIKKNDSEEYIDVYTLQARHDILEKLPLFLYDYVYDPHNGLVKVKEESLKFCFSRIERCLKMLQCDYSNSPFFSNSFIKKSKNNMHIWNARGQRTSGVESEFLKILGRYYFLMSKEFAKGFKIESCREQNIISRFAQIYYPRKKIVKAFDPVEKTIVESKDLYDYKWKSLRQLDEVTYLPIPPPDDLIGGFLTLGAKIIRSFYDDDYNDPAGITEYYLNWFINLKIFSTLELGIITLIFIRGIVQKQLEKDRDDSTTKRLPSSLVF